MFPGQLTLVGNYHFILTHRPAPVQYHRASLAAVPESAEGRVPRGATQHHLQPGLRQRGDRHQAAVTVSTPGHCRAGRRHQMAGPTGHHRVHASFSWTAGTEEWVLLPSIPLFTFSVYLHLPLGCRVISLV